MINVKKILTKLVKISSTRKGADIKLQNAWKNKTIKQRQELRKTHKDSDGDRVPNKWDCKPNNIFRQDTMQQPYQEQVFVQPEQPHQFLKPQSNAFSPASRKLNNYLFASNYARQAAKVKNTVNVRNTSI